MTDSTSIGGVQLDIPLVA